MSMGDGVLKVNPDALKFTRSRQRFLDAMNKANNTNITMATYKSWKYGDLQKQKTLNLMIFLQN